MPISAIILDFDGLIIDSETPLLEIWQEIFQEHGGMLALEDWQHALGTHDGFDPFVALERQTGAVLARLECRRRVTQEHWRRCELQPLLPGVGKLLDQARGLEVKTAVASSSGRDWVEPWLTRHGLMDRIDTICTRDDVQRVKPAPDLFLLAAGRLDVPPGECVVFEDSPNGIRAARAAGMWAVAVPAGLTRTLPLPEPHLVRESLEAVSLVELGYELSEAMGHSPRSTSTGSVPIARRAGR